MSEENASVGVKPQKLTHGSPEFASANRALFLGGFAAFVMLNWIQPVFPAFSEEFGVSATSSSLALSFSTATLAICLILASVLSDRTGRVVVMRTALFVSALSTLACALADSFWLLLVTRVVLGAAVAGLPAVAMTYLAEEFDAKAVGYSVGLVIAGNALGGMVGRVVASAITDYFSWRAAALIIGVAGLAVAIEFTRSLPPSRHFRARRSSLSAFVTGARAQLREPGLQKLFLISFLIMGSFAGAYNFLGYRLLGPAFGLTHTQVGFIFGLYILGMFSSVWMGKLSDRFGRRRVLWGTILIKLLGLLLTLSGEVVVVIIGVSLLTFGFFGAHSVASSWVSLRARENKALAASIYLACYYIGASVLGSSVGIVYENWAWAGLLLALTCLTATALALALSLRRLPPLPA